METIQLNKNIHTSQNYSCLSQNYFWFSHRQSAKTQRYKFEIPQNFKTFPEFSRNAEMQVPFKQQ